MEPLAQRGQVRLEETEPSPVSAEAPSASASLGVDRARRGGARTGRRLVAEGRTNLQIGQALFITPKTTSVHVSRILAELGVTGRGEAAVVAHRLGLDKH